MRHRLVRLVARVAKVFDGRATIVEDALPIDPSLPLDLATWREPR